MYDKTATFSSSSSAADQNSISRFYQIWRLRKEEEEEEEEEDMPTKDDHDHFPDDEDDAICLGRLFHFLPLFLSLTLSLFLSLSK
jgi:hypothetical protein